MLFTFSYYYHDVVLQTCLLDSYNLIEHVRSLLDEGKPVNDSTIISDTINHHHRSSDSKTSRDCPVPVQESNNVVIIIATNAVLFIITWITLIIGCCRIENTLVKRDNWVENMKS